MEEPGFVLRSVRCTARISLEALAHRTGYSKGHLAKVETGKRHVTIEIVEAYMRELGVDPTRRRMLKQVLATLVAATGIPGDLLDATPNQADERTTLLERAAQGGLLGTTVLDALRAITMELRHRDDHLGGGAVVPLVEPHLDLITTMLRNGSFTPALREQFHLTLADAAELAGWAAYDSGDPLLSARYYAISLDAAHQSGDPLMVTQTLAMMAFGARYEPDPGAIRLLDAAESSVPAGRRNNGVRSMIAAWRMFALAAQGDRGGFDRAHSQAVTLYEASDPDDWPSWMYWLWHPDAMADTGNAFNRLGDHGQALKVLTVGETMSAEWPRDRALYVAFMAEAHRGLHDREAAQHHHDRAIELVGDEIISGRLAKLLSL